MIFTHYKELRRSPISTEITILAVDRFLQKYFAGSPSYSMIRHDALTIFANALVFDNFDIIEEWEAYGLKDFGKLLLASLENCFMDDSVLY